MSSTRPEPRTPNQLTERQISIDKSRYYFFNSLLSLLSFSASSALLLYFAASLLAGALARCDATTPKHTFTHILTSLCSPFISYTPESSRPPPPPRYQTLYINSTHHHHHESHRCSCGDNAQGWRGCSDHARQWLQSGGCDEKAPTEATTTTHNNNTQQQLCLSYRLCVRKTDMSDGDRLELELMPLWTMRTAALPGFLCCPNAWIREESADRYL